VLARLSTPSLDRIKVGVEVDLVLERLYTDQDGSEVITWKFRPV
jgi:hypothetical protein